MKFLVLFLSLSGFAQTMEQFVGEFKLVNSIGNVACDENLSITLGAETFSYILSVNDEKFEDLGYTWIYPEEEIAIKLKVTDYKIVKFTHEYNFYGVSARFFKQDSLEFLDKSLLLKMSEREKCVGCTKIINSKTCEYKRI